MKNQITFYCPLFFGFYESLHESNHLIMDEHCNIIDKIRGLGLTPPKKSWVKLKDETAYKEEVVDQAAITMSEWLTEALGVNATIQWVDYVSSWPANGCIRYMTNQNTVDAILRYVNEHIDDFLNWDNDTYASKTDMWVNDYGLNLAGNDFAERLRAAVAFVLEHWRERKLSFDTETVENDFNYEVRERTEYKGDFTFQFIDANGEEQSFQLFDYIEQLKNKTINF